MNKLLDGKTTVEKGNKDVLQPRNTRFNFEKNLKCVINVNRVVGKTPSKVFKEG